MHSIVNISSAKSTIVANMMSVSMSNKYLNIHSSIFWGFNTKIKIRLCTGVPFFQFFLIFISFLWPKPFLFFMCFIL